MPLFILGLLWAAIAGAIPDIVAHEWRRDLAQATIKRLEEPVTIGFSAAMDM